MKHKILISMILLFGGFAIQNTMGQGGTYQSMIDNNKFVEVTITMQGNDAYVTRKAISGNSGIGRTVFNLTSLPWIEKDDTSV
jgi:hypothetical protein